MCMRSIVECDVVDPLSNASCFHGVFRIDTKAKVVLVRQGSMVGSTFLFVVVYRRAAATRHISRGRRISET